MKVISTAKLYEPVDQTTKDGKVTTINGKVYKPLIKKQKVAKAEDVPEDEQAATEGNEPIAGYMSRSKPIDVNRLLYMKTKNEVDKFTNTKGWEV